jgi:phosphoribosyl-dephospho-CoA transferase
MSQYRRHDLVWLMPLEGKIPERDEDALIYDWIRKERPFVVRRREDSNQDHIPLGFQRLNSHHKQKISLSVTQDKITKKSQPLQLSEILNILPSSVLDGIEKLLLWAHRIDLQPQIYGSFSWQALTGEPYVTENSDLDLLWHIKRPDHIPALLDYLSLAQRKIPLRIDGEIIFPSHQAVAWRELQMSTQNVLVKTTNRVELISRDRIDDFFETIAC